MFYATEGTGVFFSAPDDSETAKNLKQNPSAALAVADPVTDWGNPNLVRASKGTVFSVPVAAGPVAAVLAWLRHHDIALVATTPATDTDYADIDYRGGVAIAVGAARLTTTPSGVSVNVRSAGSTGAPSTSSTPSSASNMSA